MMDVCVSRYSRLPARIVSSRTFLPSFLLLLHRPRLVLSFFLSLSLSLSGSCRVAALVIRRERRVNRGAFLGKQIIIKSTFLRSISSARVYVCYTRARLLLLVSRLSRIFFNFVDFVVGISQKAR